MLQNWKAGPGVSLNGRLLSHLTYPIRLEAGPQTSLPSDQ